MAVEERENVMIHRPGVVPNMRERGLPERAIQVALNFHSDVRNGLRDEVSPEMERLIARKSASLRDGLKILFNL